MCTRRKMIRTNPDPEYAYVDRARESPSVATDPYQQSASRRLVAARRFLECRAMVCIHDGRELHLLVGGGSLAPTLARTANSRRRASDATLTVLTMQADG